MRSWQDSQRSVLDVVIRLGLTLVVLALAAALLALFRSERWAIQWPLLLQLVGASILLVGVIDLIRRVFSGPQLSLSAIAGDVAVVLAGGILVGGGWGAALGLGAIAVAGLLAERRNNAGDGDHSAQQAAAADERRARERRKR